MKLLTTIEPTNVGPSRAEPLLWFAPLALCVTASDNDGGFSSRPIDSVLSASWLKKTVLNDGHGEHPGSSRAKARLFGFLGRRPFTVQHLNWCLILTSLLPLWSPCESIVMLSLLQGRGIPASLRPFSPVLVAGLTFGCNRQVIVARNVLVCRLF
jgi:hypothetical protein